ncbi:MAG: SigB/SigF/SigG family RNA polymerase sigma factor [Eubacteriales bacterium]|nr:SigB/SigF/SigG family RNA polymerase sigma factor [Eubacteriales bacterium]
MEQTLALIKRAHQGDKRARDAVVEENTGLVYTVARRFMGRGVEMEDLLQIGYIGLLKAVDKFEPAFEVRFSTYAVPMIAGEIKRYLRDDGPLKVSRSLKEIHGKIYQEKERLERQYGREPTIQEISASMNLPLEEVVMALDCSFQVESLQKVVYQGDGSEISLMDRLPEKEDGQEKLLNRLLLEEVLTGLPPKERKLIYLRYFQDMTQTQIALLFGVSQVQISRMEKRVLKALRGRLEGSS